MDNDRHTEWLDERQTNIDWCNWHTLKQHLTTNEGFPKLVVDTIEDCMSILGDCGDPERNEWRRSGLVIGHVQSGKTTNYSALSSMAIGHTR